LRWNESPWLQIGKTGISGDSESMNKNSKEKICYAQRKQDVSVQNNLIYGASDWEI
jgi:hypothetical protein